jgi:hypothetical protein
VPDRQPAPLELDVDALGADLGDLDPRRPLGADDVQLAAGEPDLQVTDLAVEFQPLWVGDLPPGPDTFSLDADQASVMRRLGAGPYDVIVCFCTTRERLAARWASLHPRTTPAGALWIAWPKRASGVPTDLNENVVREFALGHGRVDVKVCAIDDVWSGLKHVIRVADRRS